MRFLAPVLLRWGLTAALAGVSFTGVKGCMAEKRKVRALETLNEGLARRIAECGVVASAAVDRAARRRVRTKEAAGLFVERKKLADPKEREANRKKIIESKRKFFEGR